MCLEFPVPGLASFNNKDLAPFYQIAEFSLALGLDLIMITVIIVIILMKQNNNKL